MAETPDDETVRDNRLTDREAEVLPVWAQQRMSDLRAAAERAQKQYDKQFDSQEPTGILYGDVYNNPRFLPDKNFDTIHVSLLPAEQLAVEDPLTDNWIQIVRKKEGWNQRPYMELTGADTLIIEPQASNTIRVRVLTEADKPS